MRKLHSKKTSGKTLDGANVFLEIVARDSHMQRDLLAEVKKKVRSAKRLEEVEERHRERERKRRPRPKLAGRRNGGLSLGTRIRVLTQQALFGQASAELDRATEAMRTNFQRLRYLSFSWNAPHERENPVCWMMVSL